MAHHHDDPWKPVGEEDVRAHQAWLERTDGTTTGRLAGRLAERTSRRGVLSLFSRLALGAAGATTMASLPIARTVVARAQEAEPAEEYDYTGTDPTDCNYWRYCNMGGRMCADCEGGGAITCPPGSKLGVEYWVGCCEDPETGQAYLIANYDCCGKTGCGAGCGEPFMQDTPPEFPPGSRDRNVLWCMSDETQTYTCTVTPIIGENCTPEPAPRSRAGR